MGRIKSKGAPDEDKRQRMDEDKAMTKLRKAKRKAELRNGGPSQMELVKLEKPAAEFVAKMDISKLEKVAKSAPATPIPIAGPPSVDNPNKLSKKKKPHTFKGDTGKKSIQQQPKHAQQQGLELWKKTLKALETALAAGNGGQFEEHDHLLHWLNTQRKQFDTEQLEPWKIDALTALRAHDNFNWLQVAFRKDRFEKALALRKEWGGIKLAKDAWLREQHKLLGQDRIPAVYREVLEELNARAEGY